MEALLLELSLEPELVVDAELSDDELDEDESDDEVDESDDEDELEELDDEPVELLAPPLALVLRA